ncbi:spermidine synthase [Burkholderiaceae bacterium FT117]|uniref:spermidine synthase n=1 Tax=Zeimonas sediminis TaxID=2944268 RepID=UPI002342C94F|nr:spermidine synthase [Zeimonas sediminis]MCM5568965.1 spermidine synthase [Zeimonas sediminis]
MRDPAERRAPRASRPQFAEPSITLSEENGIRYLHFGSEWVQGAMFIRRPWDIAIDYVAQMMGWLLFLDPPARILQLGLGAGALTRWCWRRLPDTGVDVVEASAGVIRVARSQFALPPDDARLAVHHADAARFMAAAAASLGPAAAPGAGQRRWGVIQADLYDAEARGPVCDSLAFYRDCRAALDPAGGMLVVNLFGEHASYARNIARIRRAFEGRVLEMPQVRAGNVVVLAFTGPPLSVEAGALTARAVAVERRWRLPATGWARALLDGAGRRSSGGAVGPEAALVV